MYQNSNKIHTHTHITGQNNHSTQHHNCAISFKLSPNVLPITSLCCIGGLPHRVDAFWLLAEGVSVAAGGGAKVYGDNDNERSLWLQLVVVILLDRENTTLQERFHEPTISSFQAKGEEDLNKQHH